MINFLLLWRGISLGSDALHMEAQTTVSNSTQCGLFIGEYKKYTISGLTLSFNN